MTRRRLCKLLREGVKDEASAGPFYTKLISEARKAGVSASMIDSLKDIRGDERGHLSKVKAFERRYC